MADMLSHIVLILVCTCLAVPANRLAVPVNRDVHDEE